MQEVGAKSITPSHLFGTIRPAMYNCHEMPAARSDPETVTRLLLSWSVGDRVALDELLSLVFRELRGLAAGYLRRERRDHTLQPTALGKV
jgi:hypothetical protein